MTIYANSIRAAASAALCVCLIHGTQAQAQTTSTLLPPLPTTTVTLPTITLPTTTLPALGSNRPNILFIMGDDHPWPSYGFMAKIARRQAPWDASNASLAAHQLVTSGRTLFQHPALPALDGKNPPGCANGSRACDTGTPNFDRLAARGAVFPVAYVSHARCVESFRSTISGLLTTQFGTVGPPAKNDTEPKMGDYLTGQAGYLSYGYGKLWNKSFTAIGFDVGPAIRAHAMQRAAKSAALVSGPDRKFYKNELVEWNAVSVSGERSKARPRRGLHSLTKFFEAYYDESVFAGDVDDESVRPPWLVWYSPRLPHHPLTRDKRYIRDVVSEFKIGGKRGPRFFGNIRLLDERLGELLDVIESYGEMDNTLIVYQSDHGAFLDTSKASSGENGYRTVVLASGPGIAPAQVLPQMVHGIDIMPTLFDYACEGVACPPAPDYWLGQSFRPFLEGGALLPGRPILFAPKIRPFRRLARTLDGYRIRNQVKKNKYELFDLVADPDETTDVKDQHPLVFQLLRNAVDTAFPGPTPAR